MEEGKSFRDYITEYVKKAKDDQIHRITSVLGVDEEALRTMMKYPITEENINEFGRYDALKSTIDRAKAKKYFEAVEGKKIIPPKAYIKADNLLRRFIIAEGFDIEWPEMKK